MRTPYIVGPPVRLPTDFFGRAAQTRQFYDLLAGPQVQCVSVLGLRRAGKTSFLQHVAHPEVMAGYLSDAGRYLMVSVDVSACKTPADFYTRVGRRLLAALSPQTAQQEPPGDAYGIESLLYDLADRRVVLLLDEFDQLRAADFGADFMTELRALAGVWDYELGFVTASYWDLYRLGNFVGLPVTSPFYNIFHPTAIYLSGLSPAELDDLVRVPARHVGIVAEDGVLVSDAAAIHLACVDNQCQTYIGEDCAFLVGRTFLSDEQLECGLGPNGVELCNWTVSFTATMFNYQHSDLGESSDYTCEAGVITAGSYTGTVDAEGFAHAVAQAVTAAGSACCSSNAPSATSSPVSASSRSTAPTAKPARS